MRTRRAESRLWIQLLAIGATLGLGPLASAQTGTPVVAQPEQAPTVDELTVMIRALLAENDALRDENKELRERVAELEAAAGVGPKPGAGATPPDPLASPDSMFDALRFEYEEAFPPESRPVSQDELVTYQRAVQRWTRQMPRELRGRTGWVVRAELIDAPPDAREREAMVTVLDPATLDAIGEPVEIVVPTRFVDRIESAKPTDLWELTGHLQAEPVFDEGRATVGPFNFPRLIGPYASFGFEMRWISLIPTTPDKVREGRVPADGEPVER